jgi:ABC-type antimicrobial peptide transport system permease subunit
VVRADVVPVHRAARRRTVAGLALSHVARVPARTVAGVVALAVGVCALTVQLAVSWTFQEALAGTYSILGDAVLREVAAVDRVAVVVTVLLGTVAVADAGYLNVRERAAEFAVLHALGWTGWATGRLVLFEALAVGVLGASVGAGSGLGIVAALVGGVPGPVRTPC